MSMIENRQLLLEEYSTLFDYVYRYVRSRVYDPETCNDLVSDIFLQALAHIDDFNAERGSLRQWITGITKNRLFTYWKKHKEIISLDDIEFGEIPQFDQLAFDQLIDHLPTHVRQLLIWRYIEDLPYEQIATLANKSPAAIRQYFSRLHKQLRTHYENL